VADDLLLLDNDDVAGVLDMGDCMAALERAYLALSAGKSVERTRSQMRVPLEEPDVTYCFKSMEGALVGDGYTTLRITSDAVFEGKVDGKVRREKLPRGAGDTYCGLIFVFSTRNLAPVAIIHDGLIQLVRVACTSALSARALARDDADTLGLIGTGNQAWWHVRAVNAVRKLDRIRLYSPNPARRAAFAARVTAELGIKTEAVSTAREAVSDAGIVVAATNASEPVLDGAWIEQGAHVISIVSGDKGSSRRELDNETMRRAALVVAHSKAGAMDQRNGDLACPVDDGILTWEKIVDLPDLLAGNSPRRGGRDDITVFKNNGGTGLQFAAVAPAIYEGARRKGIGRKLPSAWFLEKMQS